MIKKKHATFLLKLCHANNKGVWIIKLKKAFNPTFNNSKNKN